MRLGIIFIISESADYILYSSINRLMYKISKKDKNGKDIHFTIMQIENGEKQQIITREDWELVNDWHFCL